MILAKFSDYWDDNMISLFLGIYFIIFVTLIVILISKIKNIPKFLNELVDLALIRKANKRLKKIRRDCYSSKK